MTANRRIGWAALWLRASFCFREDVLQLARTGHPWATSRRPDEADLLRRIRTLARRWEQASRRAHEILFGELDDDERAHAVLALGVLVECGYLPPDAVSGYLMAVVTVPARAAGVRGAGEDIDAVRREQGPLGSLPCGDWSRREFPPIPEPRA